MHFSQMANNIVIRISTDRKTDSCLSEYPSLVRQVVVKSHIYMLEDDSSKLPPSCSFARVA